MGLWTPLEDAKLRQLYDEQYSCSQIAGFFEGKTRNAIIGRVHRLKLSLRGAGITPAKAKRKGRNSAPETLAKPRKRPLPPPAPPQEEVIMRCAAIEPINFTLAELEPHHCRWPYGEGPFTFCGHIKFDWNDESKKSSSSYCGAHHFLGLRTEAEGGKNVNAA